MSLLSLIADIPTNAVLRMKITELETSLSNRLAETTALKSENTGLQRQLAEARDRIAVLETPQKPVERAGRPFIQGMNPPESLM